MFTSELEFQCAVYNELLRQTTVFREVPCLSRSIDIVINSSPDDPIVAIELKISNWRRGLSQARDHLVAVHCSLVCLPNPPSFRARKTFDKSPVGLLHYSKGSFRFCSEPAFSAPQWRITNRWMMEYLWSRRESDNGQHYTCGQIWDSLRAEVFQG